MSFPLAYSMKKRAGKGSPAMGAEPAGEHDADMIARVLHKRKQLMAEGGEIESEEAPLDTMAADDTGANSGDELGDAEHHDIISKVLKSRAKKDRMPRPA